MTDEAEEGRRADDEFRALRGMGALPFLNRVRASPLPPIAPEDLISGIASRFRLVAAECPNNIAIWKPDHRVSYAELDRQSDAVAVRLMQQFKPGQGPVALGTEDPIGHVIGLLAILKAGRYYLPISHQLPGERRKLLIASVSPDAAVVTTSAEAETLECLPCVKLFSEHMLASGLPGAIEWPAPAAAAFVLFTSGSTGTPKGVVQSQTNLLRNTAWQTEALSIDCTDRFSQLHADGTMGAVRATLNALLNGATLCPFEVSRGDVTALGEWLRIAKPTILHSSASFFRVFARALPMEPNFSSVRLLILGGEAVTGEDFDLYRTRFPSTSHLCTGLGSTETTTVRMMCLPPNARPVLSRGRLPLGFPVPGTTIRLANGVSDAAGLGVIGEMELESSTLFPGYWPLDGKELKKSGRFSMGDLALRTQEGVLYHAGRKDHQVKVNGNRVDLLEIERCVRQINGVSDACVMTETVHGSNIRILLFLLRQDPTALTIDKVRYFLRRWFPPYMQPRSIFLRDNFPRIAGGKIDLGQLREIAKHEHGADAVAALRRDRSGADAKLLDCLLETSYPALLSFISSMSDLSSFDSMELRKFQFDSLSALEICLNIESQFGRRLAPGELASFRRYSDLLKALQNG